jgi:PAX-interacting protein 1
MHGLQFQLHNQGQSPPNPLLANQSQAYQQLLSQNIQNSIPSTEVPIGANFPSAMPPISGLNQTSIRNVVGQDMNVQNIFGTSQNLVFAND